MFNSLHEECGVFGIFENKTTYVARSTYLGLYALQHRGQESCGIAVNDDGVFSHYRGDGLVPEVFTKEKLDGLGKGNMAIGHVRYSTTGGGDNPNNVQPLVIRHIKGNLALAHNGNIVNAAELRKAFELGGAIFHGTSDTESIAYAIVQERLVCESTEGSGFGFMNRLNGAFMCCDDSTNLSDLFRPLCIGKTDDGAYVIASESCALDTIGAKFIRDIAPGEIVTVSTDGVSSDTSHCGKCKGGMCVFEYIYFARPDSVIEGSSVQQARMRAGEFLAKESPVDADIVIGVPDSGLDAALGYSKESGIPYGVGFIKNKYIGRSFIQPSQDQREDAVRIKLNVVRPNIEGKRVIMIDDSIVRGTTCARIVDLLREAGAKEVHMRVSSPPFRYPCYFGTDVDSQENLIACKYNSVDDIAKIIGVDSLAYLSIDATHKLASQTNISYCDGCFTGKYPIEVPKEQPKDKFETKLNRFSAYYQVLD